MLPRQQSLVTGRPGTQNEGGASPSMRGIVGFINQIVEGPLFSHERFMEGAARERAGWPLIARSWMSIDGVDKPHE